MPTIIADRLERARSSNPLLGLDITPKGLSVYDALRPRHRMFVEAYLACAMNATQAYKLVYPRSNDVNAHTIASQLCAHPAVREAISERARAIGYRNLISGEWYVSRLLKELDHDANKPADRARYLEMIGKVGRFIDEQGAPVVIFAQLVGEARKFMSASPKTAPSVPQDQRSPADPHPDTPPFQHMSTPVPPPPAPIEEAPGA